MEETQHNVQFYKESLRKVETDIMKQLETGKASKDIIGEAFETHRERIWKYFGFNVSKEKHGAKFDVDWAVTYKGKLIALEEDKGHYVDSCFLERALSGFSKTVYAYKQEGKQVPLLILHSFTRYNKYNEKFEEDMNTRKPEIKDELKKKMVYSTLVNRDRLPKEEWIGSKKSTRNDSYSHFSEDDLIQKDIEFIKSLIPVSE